MEDDVAYTSHYHLIKRRRPKVVVIGGGTGLPVILNSLRDKDVDITAIVTVADDGGSSGIIRNFINVVPPGDIRNVLVALSDLPQLPLEIFQYRFESTDAFLAGHTIGNLIITALAEMKSGIFDAIQVLSKMMHVDGKVYPVSNTPLTLHAEFEDGSTKAGETEISHARKLIKRVWVTETHPTKRHPYPKAMNEVINAIINADAIVLGPGSLFTSILPNLMIDNVGQAVINTKAEVIYICNLMTQKGETEHFTDADHVRVLNQHLQHHFINTVLVNNHPIPSNYMDRQKYNEYLEPVKSDFQGLRRQGCRVISNDFLSLHDHGIFHNGDKIATEIVNLALEARARRKL
ncbi:MAG: uridine diphosphate-N-acetylglucosamine-binding protein YvcK [Candidatus Paralactobacillus gallistercoris]|uniref:Putative gluconeogenesis factor n=1 Tax=Candidatus Paralactobacillus gallistercoris TaxID=2838724 RepID=A0A948TJN4_9LACO|nr:uridine diphosphate-N-acetylglucosamine-binding protein YvcK [Candidatus Paralactobacillus gallistercoris]